MIDNKIIKMVERMKNNTCFNLYDLDQNTNKNEYEIGGTYKKYIEDNQECVDTLYRISHDKYGRYLMTSETGSGKTHAIFNIKDLDYNIQLCPYRTISDQISHKYNTTRVIGGDFIEPKTKAKEEVFDEDGFMEVEDVIEDIDFEELVKEFDETHREQEREIADDRKKFSVLMDKCDEMKKYLIEVSKHKELTNGLVWVDEAHLFCESASFRKGAYNKFLDFIKFIEENTDFSIVYVTATPERCQLLNYDKVIILKSEDDKTNIEKVGEYRCREDMSYNDLIISKKKKKKKKGHKIICNLNNKYILDNLCEYYERKGNKVGLITGDNKNENETFDIISNTSSLDETIDILFVTCVLDAGISIEKTNTIIDKQNENEPQLDNEFYFEILSNKYVPIYCYDKNGNIDNLKQFSNRFRFNIKKLIIIVDKHEVRIDEFSKMKTLKEFCENGNLLETWKSLKEYANALKVLVKDEKDVEKSLKKILNKYNYFDEKNDMGGVFEYSNNDYIFNRQLAFNREYTEFMNQYFYYDYERTLYLKECVFGCEIEIADEFEVEDKEYFDYKESRFEDFLYQLAANKNIQDNFFGSQDKIDSEIKGNKKFAKLEKLCKYEDLQVAINHIIEMSPVKLGKHIVEVEYNHYKNNIVALTFGSKIPQYFYRERAKVEGEKDKCYDLSQIADEITQVIAQNKELEECISLTQYLLTSDKYKKMFYHIYYNQKDKYNKEFDFNEGDPIRNLGAQILIQNIFEIYGKPNRGYGIKEYKKKEIKLINEKYKNNEKAIGPDEVQIFTIINIIEKKRKNNQIQLTITKQIINEIKKKYRKMTEEEIEELIKAIYKYGKDDNKLIVFEIR